MGTMVTLELQGDVAERAQRIADQTRRSVEEVLLDWLWRVAAGTPEEMLTDEQVPALRAAKMNTDDQAELSELLARQREGDLDAHGHELLAQLIHTYRRGMILKAQAFELAVEYGLLPPRR